jgi:hypothetical protein
MDLGGANTEGISDPPDVREAWVPLAPFNTARVGPIQSGVEGKLLLRQASLLAQSTNGCAKSCMTAGANGHWSTFAA